MAEDEFKEYLRRQEAERQRAQQYPQQPQQYPQQYPQYRQPQYGGGQYPQQPYPRPQQPAPSGSHSKFILLLIIFLALIGVALLLFFITGKEKAAEQPVIIAAAPAKLSEATAGDVPPEDLEPALAITAIKFASDVQNVGNDLTYTEVTDSTFSKTEQPWVVVHAEGLKAASTTKGWKTSYEEYISVVGPDGRTIEAFSGYLGTTTKDAGPDTFRNITVGHQLLVDESYQTGEYLVAITIRDALGGLESTETGAFTIR